MPFKKSIAIIVFSLLMNNFAIAQHKEEMERIYGKVMDAKTNQPVGFSSAALYTIPKDSLIAGVLVSDNGEFLFTNIPYGKYILRIKFIGYKEDEQIIIVSEKNNNPDLGNIKLEPNPTQLNEVEVITEKAAMTMSIDKKIYNVDKDLSVKGGTGLDALKNVPGVSVDADGSVTLRNNHVQIYVDGTQTSLTLQQIPEPQIELKYFEISDAETLQPINHLSQSKKVVACITVKLGKIRLIDNVVF